MGAMSIPTNSNLAHHVLTLGVDRRLAGKLFQYLRRARQPVPRLSHGAVKHQLIDLEVPHRVGLGLGLRAEVGVAKGVENSATQVV